MFLVGPMFQRITIFQFEITMNHSRIANFFSLLHYGCSSFKFQPCKLICNQSSFLWSQSLWITRQWFRFQPWCTMDQNGGTKCPGAGTKDWEDEIDEIVWYHSSFIIHHHASSFIITHHHSSPWIIITRIPCHNPLGIQRNSNGITHHTTQRLRNTLSPWPRLWCLGPTWWTFPRTAGEGTRQHGNISWWTCAYIDTFDIKLIRET